MVCLAATFTPSASHHHSLAGLSPSSPQGRRCAFVGASLLANRASQRASRQATHRWQAGLPQAHKPASPQAHKPTRQAVCICRNQPAGEWCQSTCITSSPPIAGRLVHTRCRFCLLPGHAPLNHPIQPVASHFNLMKLNKPISVTFIKIKALHGLLNCPVLTKRQPCAKHSIQPLPRCCWQSLAPTQATAGPRERQSARLIRITL